MALENLKSHFIKAAVEELLRRSLNVNPEELKNEAYKILMKNPEKVIEKLMNMRI